jgi:metal-sulfur cluster biosynthetic enzyme
VSAAATHQGAAAARRSHPLRDSDVIAALADVLDPELDEPIVELGFVQGIRIAGAVVRVELRLPTYWCAPNFSWLMAEDVREALVRDPRVAAVEVVLADHHAATDISAGVSSGRSFGDVFGADEDGRLSSLRDLFRRKALLARQERALGPLRRSGHELAGLRIADLPDTDEVRAYLSARIELGLDCSPQAAALSDAAGRPVPGDHAEAHLRRARLMRVSTEGNAAFCRGLLATRYGEARR